MKRILPLLVIAAALIGGAIFLFSGTPQTADVPDEVAVSERTQIEAAGQLNNVTTRAVDIDD